SAQPAQPAVPLRERIRQLLKSISDSATFPIKELKAVGAKQDQERLRRTTRLSRLWDSDFFEYAPHLLDAAGGPTHLLTLRKQFLFNASSPLTDSADYGMFRLVPQGGIRNWLLFIPSSRGPDYYYERFGA